MSELSCLRGSERYGACEEEAGPVLAYGIGVSVVYGLILRFVFGVG